MFWRSVVCRGAVLRGVALFVVALLLSGCVTARTGFDYAAIMQKVGPPAAGHARIVFLSEKRPPNAAFAELVVDGVPTKRLKPGTYVYADRPAGKHEIVATESLYMGETRQEFATTPGRTYFLAARPTERYRIVSSQIMMGGIIGGLTATAITAGYKNLGPVDLFPLDEAAARIAIAELQLAE